MRCVWLADIQVRVILLIEERIQCNLENVYDTLTILIYILTLIFFTTSNQDQYVK